jgi:hypothetical protein
MRSSACVSRITSEATSRSSQSQQGLQPAQSYRREPQTPDELPPLRQLRGLPPGDIPPNPNSVPVGRRFTDAKARSRRTSYYC